MIVVASCADGSFRAQSGLWDEEKGESRFIFYNDRDARLYDDA